MAAGLTCMAILVLWCLLWLFLLSHRQTARRIKRVLLQAGAAAIVLALLGISAMAVAQAAEELEPSRAAAAGRGTTGVFTADQTQETGLRMHNRSWTGRFVSTDGTVVRDGVILEGAPSDMALGRAVPAVDTGAVRVVYGEAATAAGNLATLILVPAAWIIAAILATIVRWRTQRRTAEPARTIADSA